MKFSTAFLTLASIGSALSQCTGYSSSTSTCVVASQTIGGTAYNIQWYLPNAMPSALMLVQHGFSRSCKHLRDTSKAYAEKGIMAFCVQTDMAAGNPAFGDVLGDAMAARTLVPPGGRPLPINYIVAGHSAGGHFASEVGQRLVVKGYPNLKGAILFDGVAAEGFTANLQAISASGQRPVLQISARPSVINLFNNAHGALASLGADFVGIQLVWTMYAANIAPTGGSCHIDCEGNNTDFIGIAGALCTPNDIQVARLREFTSVWARDMATGSYTSSYYCSNADNLATCGAAATALLGGTFPLAAVIPNSP